MPKSIQKTNPKKKPLRFIETQFTIFPGIGAKMESMLYQANYKTWDDIFTNKSPDKKLEKVVLKLQSLIPQLREALSSQNFEIVKKNLPVNHHWMILPYCANHIAYLDIETTGLSKIHNKITTIAVYWGGKTYDFIKGQNLSEFPSFISQIPIIATYFGKVFDIPFCKSYFSMEFSQLHLDLCFLGRKVQLRGGLKGVENKLGLHRTESAGVDGAFAVRLWKKYQKTHEERYLQTLLAYNNEDVYSLEVILHHVYNRMVKKSGYSDLGLPIPAIFAQNPAQADPSLLFFHRS
jgi:uncharacterized protein